MEMENEARPRQRALLKELGIADEETRQAREATRVRDRRRGGRLRWTTAAWPGNVTGFDGNLGLVIGAGGGSLTLFDAVRKYGGKPANYCEIGGNPSVAKAAGLAKLVLSKPGVEKIAVMMSIVSNTRVDIVARGVIKACLELGNDPAEKIAIFRIPGAWEDEGFKILEKYGVEYCDRSVSMHEAARRAVEKIGMEPNRGRRMSILIDENTTFIVQGITGREAVNLTRECLDYGKGAKVVGGVTPGRKGREVHGVPVFDTVEQAVENHGAPINGSVVTVPPAFTKDAVFEALEHGIELIVIVTERIPRRDVAQMVELADREERAHHRAELSRRDRPGRDQDGRHRRARRGRGEGLHARQRRRDVAQRRNDDGDLEHAHRRGPRAIDRRVDRRRRHHRLHLHGADADVRGRRAD